MAEHTPTGMANLTPQVWAAEIQMAVYQAMRVAPYFKDGGKSGEQINIRKYGALARTAPAGSAALMADDLTLSEGADTAVTPTPVTSYVAMFLNDNFIARMLNDPTDQLRQASVDSVAEGVDIECAKLADDLTTIVGGVGQDVTEAEFLIGRDTVAEATAGQDAGRRVFCFHHKQGKHVIVSTQNWSQYRIRGDNDNPVATGELKHVYGYRFIETGNIQNIGGLFHNPLFVDQMTFMIGYNQRPTGEIQRNGMGKLVIQWTDFWVGTIWADRGADFNTKTT